MTDIERLAAYVYSLHQANLEVIKSLGTMGPGFTPSQVREYERALLYMAAAFGIK